jgi:uncharacterized protein (DUF983 family)
MQYEDKRSDRSVGLAMLNGLRCRCPACGEGRLFASYLKPVRRCEHCQHDFTGQKSDDLPPYITIFAVGHIVVPLILAVESARTEWPVWLHLTIWLPLTLLLALVFMQPVKGAVIGLQWAMRLHGFGQPEPEHGTSAEPPHTGQEIRS